MFANRQRDPKKSTLVYKSPCKFGGAYRLFDKKSLGRAHLEILCQCGGR